MKKSIFIFSAIVLLFSFSNMSAQKSCCNKAHENTSCNKSYKNSSCNKSCDKNKTSFKAEKGAKSTSFNVSGNCEMCEARIEKAALGINGVKTANWDKTSKLLVVTYDGDVKKDEIELAISKVGHDTPDYKAKDEVYNALPDCCKYER